MSRVKRGTVVKKRHKRVLKLAKVYRGAKSKLFRTAKDAVTKAGSYAYRDRRRKKRDFRKLWIARISAACRANDITYSRFIDGLNKAEIQINRKVLSNLAIEDPAAFKELVEKARAAVNV